MLVIAVANQKGGVGKTTSAYHMLWALQSVVAGRVLAVDADPQGNLTRVVADPPTSEDQAGLADVLSKSTDVTIDDVIVSGRWDRLDLVPTPSTRVLATVRDELIIAGVGREQRLKQALDSVSDQYEVCLIDCPPSLDQLTINAFTAADRVLIVTQAKLFSSDGLSELLRTIDEVRQYLNPDLGIGGALINQLEERTVTGKHWRNALTESAQERGFEILNPPIPKRAPVNDACESGTNLDMWGADGQALAQIYVQHATTLVKGAA